MPIKLIRQRDGVVRKISESHDALNLLTAEDSSKVSLSIVRAEGHLDIVKTRSDRVYYVLNGILMIDDDIRAGEGDIVFIPAKSEYKLQGSFRAIVINSPAFKK